MKSVGCWDRWTRVFWKGQTWLDSRVLVKMGGMKGIRDVKGEEDLGE